jgi:hypothetical protein
MTDLGFGQLGMEGATRHPQGVALHGIPVTAAPDRNCVTMVKGVLVATGRGDVAAEDVLAGDVILTRENVALSVLAVRLRPLTREALIAAHWQTPVLMRAGALGAGLPRNDLHLHPLTHCAVAGPGDRAMRRVTDMIGGGQVARVFPDSVTYVDFTLAAPGALQVAGIWLAFAPAAASVKVPQSDKDDAGRGWCRIGHVMPDWPPRGEAAVVESLYCCVTSRGPKLG